MARLTIVPDKTAMSEAAAERVTVLLEAAVAAQGLAAVSLTGGDTPDLLYQMLADETHPWRRRIDWQRLHVFWGDEREVPHDDQESNYGLAYRLLLRYVDVPETQVHRMRGELPASDAGRSYDAVLHARRDQTVGPLFDVMLLGIGSNAHIASIFPGSPLLARREAAPYTSDEQSDLDRAGRPFTGRQILLATGVAVPELSQWREPLATGVAVPELSQWRITMTPQALLDSARIIMIASGASKAGAIAAAIEGPADVEQYPAQLLRDAGDRLEWIIDSAAAARLRGAPPA